MHSLSSYVLLITMLFVALTQFNSETADDNSPGNDLGPCEGITSEPSVERCKEHCRKKYGCNGGMCQYSEE